MGHGMHFSGDEITRSLTSILFPGKTKNPLKSACSPDVSVHWEPPVPDSLPFCLGEGGGAVVAPGVVERPNHVDVVLVKLLEVLPGIGAEVHQPTAVEEVKVALLGNLRKMKDFFSTKFGKQNQYGICGSLKSCAHVGKQAQYNVKIKISPRLFYTQHF